MSPRGESVDISSGALHVYQLTLMPSRWLGTFNRGDVDNQ